MFDLRPLLPALFPIPLWVLAILVGLWNNRRGNSFWVGFLLSLFFTPIGGAFLIVATTTKNNGALERRRSVQEVKETFENASFTEGPISERIESCWGNPEFSCSTIKSEEHPETVPTVCNA